MAPASERKSEENATKKFKKKSVKQRIRSVKRLLSKPDLPATVRVAQERMLNVLEKALDDDKQNRKDGKMVKKYKMVKFFEKRKLWRQYRSTIKELEDADNKPRFEELKLLQNRILKDLNYVEYFPSDRKYISLFPNESYTNPKVIKEQEEVHQHINTKVEKGELPQIFLNEDDKKKSNKAKLENKKQTKLRLHMDKKENDVKPVLFTTSSNLPEDDDFFIDKCGDESNVV